MKRFVSVILSMLMLLGTLAPGAVTPVKAEAEKHEYIVSVRVDKVTGETPAALSENRYDERIECINKGLDASLVLIRQAIGDVQEKERFNFLISAFLFDLTEEEVKTLESLPFVEYVQKNNSIQAELGYKIKQRMTSSPLIIGIDKEVREKYDGRGQSVAILDNNFNPAHKVFYLDSGVPVSLTKEQVESKRANLRAKTGDKKIWYSDKVPFGWNYFIESDQLNPYKEKDAHGQHVAATAAGNKVDVYGNEWCGIAPNAQVLLMHVFQNRPNSDGSVSSGTNSSVYIKAIEDAVYLRAASINMSLGSPKGSVLTQTGLDKAVSTAIDRAVSTGTAVAIAAGNEGAYSDKISPKYPDYGAIGSPAINIGAITVASVENTKYYAMVAKFGDRTIVLRIPDGRDYNIGQYDFVDCNLGTAEDFAGKDLKGKIALIKRGNITFTEKVNNAVNAGAIGVLVYNNQEGTFGMSLSGAKECPAAAISQKDGEYIKSNPGMKIVIESDHPEMVDSPSFGELSGFSNWGLTIDGNMKPDITAPGGNIYSANTTSDGFGNMSGTSMATPHVTGCIALMRQYMDSDPKFKSLSVAERGALIKVLLMNSAVPFVEKGREAVASPRKQGAGVVNMKNATELDYTVTDSTTGIASKAFLKVEGEKLVFDLNFKNYSDQAKTLNAKVMSVYDEVIDNVLSYKTKQLFENDLDDIIEIPANGTVNKKLEVQLQNLDMLSDFVNGAFVDGYLTFIDGNGKTVNFPFVSFVNGSYADLPAVETPINKMDFSKEKPMAWGIIGKESWFELTTHLQSTVNGKPHLLGLENEGDFKGTKDLPIPQFGKIYLSPNGDGKLDTLSAYAVMMRQAYAHVELKFNETQNIEYKSIEKLCKPNISYDPTGSLSANLLGVTKFGQADLRNAKDGEYTFIFSARPSHEGAKDQIYELPLVIDRVAPEIKEAKLDDATNVLSFKLVEVNEIAKLLLKYAHEGKNVEVPLENKNGTVTATLPEGIALTDISVYAEDKAMNSTESTVDLLLATGDLGSIKVNVETQPANKQTSGLEWHIEDSDGRTISNLSRVKYGKYFLIIDKVPEDFELVGPSKMELNVQKPEPTVGNIVLKYVETISTSIIFKKRQNFDFNRIKVTLTSKSTGKTYKFERDASYSNWFTGKVPAGTYDLKIEVANNTEGYKVKAPETITVTKDDTLFYADVYLSKGKLIINTIGLEGEAPKYVVLNEDGNECDPDNLAEGSYYVYPVSVPSGYYVVPRSISFRIGNTYEEKTVSFEYKKSEGVKRTLSIESNIKGQTYNLENFEAYNDLEGNKKYSFKGEIKTNLAPDLYYLFPVATDTHYPVISNGGTESDYAEVDMTERDANVKVDWKTYESLGDEDIQIDVLVFKDKDYPFTFSDTLIFSKGGTTKEATVSLMNPSLRLKPGLYDVQLKGIKEGYVLNPSKISVYKNGSEYYLNVVKDTSDNKAQVNFKFTSEGNEITNIKFSLGDKEMNPGSAYVEKGTYNIKLLEAPTGYRLKTDPLNIVIDGTKKDIEIELVRDDTQDKIEFTFRYKTSYNVNAKDINWDFVVSGGNGEKIIPAHIPSQKAFKAYLPKGNYSYKINPLDMNAAPAFNIVDMFPVNEAKVEFDIGDIYRARKLNIKTEFYDENNKLVPDVPGKENMRFTVSKTDYTNKNKKALYSPDLVPQNTYDLTVENVPKGYKASVAKTTVMSTLNDYTLKFIKEGSSKPGYGTIAYKLEKPADFKGPFFVDVYDSNNKRITLFKENSPSEFQYGTYRVEAKMFDKNYKLEQSVFNLELSDSNRNATVVFKIVKLDALKTLKVKWNDVGVKTNNPLEDFSKLELKVYNYKTKAEIPAEKSGDKDPYWIFKGENNVYYLLEIKNAKNTYFPNLVVFERLDEVTVNAAVPGNVTVVGKAGSKDVKVSYEITADLPFNQKILLNDASKVPALSNDSSKPMYTIKLTGNEDGYKLKDENTRIQTFNCDPSNMDVNIKFEFVSTSSVDKSELEKLVNEADKVRQEARYIYASEENKAKYDNAVKSAESVMKNEEADQNAVNEAVKNINDAKKALNGVDPNEASVDKLKRLISEKESVVNSDRFRNAAADKQKEYIESIETAKNLLKVLYKHSEIELAIVRIERAIDNLRPTDYSKLEAAIQRAEKIKTEKVYEDADKDRKDKFDETLERAKAMLNEKNTAQPTVDGMIQELRDAENGLSFKTTDKTKLKSLTDEADMIRNSDNYRSSERMAKDEYDRAISAGLEILADKKADQRTVDEAAERIVAAKMRLVPFKPAPTPVPNPMPRPDYYTIPDYERDRDEIDRREESSSKKEDKKPIEFINLSIPEKTLSVWFDDILNSPYMAEILDIASRGIVVGMGDRKFEPETTLERGMIIEIMYRMTVDKTGDSVYFSDVKSDDWFYEAVKWAVKNKIVVGYEDGTFRPHGKITRQELAVILAKFIDYQFIELPQHQFLQTKDSGRIADWSKNSVQRMYGAGLIMPGEKDNYKPDGEISRGEFASVIYNLIQLVEQIKKQ